MLIKVPGVFSISKVHARQWLTVEPLYSIHIWGINFGHYIEVDFIEGLFCTQTVHLGPVLVGLSSVVAINRGSTVQPPTRLINDSETLSAAVT